MKRVMEKNSFKTIDNNRKNDNATIFNNFELKRRERNERLDASFNNPYENEQLTNRNSVLNSTVYSDCLNSLNVSNSIRNNTLTDRYSFKDFNNKNNLLAQIDIFKQSLEKTSKKVSLDKLEAKQINNMNLLNIRYKDINTRASNNFLLDTNRTKMINNFNNTSQTFYKRSQNNSRNNSNSSKRSYRDNISVAYRTDQYKRFIKYKQEIEDIIKRK